MFLLSADQLVLFTPGEVVLSIRGLELTIVRVLFGGDKLAFAIF